MKPHYKLSKPCSVCGCEYQYQSKAICVDCQKQRNRSYYQANKDKCRSLIKRWCGENVEYRRAYRRAYYENNGV